MPALSRALAVAFVIVGAVLRLWQYAGDASLWLDEVAMAQQIVDRPLRELLTMPLAFDQSAPPGFLLLEKLAVTRLGASDLALRLLPLASSLVALLAFGWLAARALDGMGPAIAVALLACAPSLIAYGSQAKPYSSDVAVAVGLLALGFELHSRGPTRARVIVAGVAGALAPWLSLPALFSLAGVGAALVLQRRGRPPGAGPGVRPLAALLALWGASGLAAIAFGLTRVTPATLDYMQRFWAGGFMPHPVSALRTLWPVNHVRWLVGSGGQANLGYPLPEVYVALMALGLASLWRRRRATALLVAGPAVVTLVAAVARQYPFSDRLILFLVPSFLLCLAEAVEQARRWVSRRSLVGGAAVALALAAPALHPVAALPPPYHQDDLKPALAHLALHRRPGDRIYVYYGASPAFSYYAARYGLRPADYSAGGCHRGDNRRYLEELDSLRGSPRAWIVLAHSLPHYRERDDIGSYLDAIGERRQAFVAPARTPGFTSPPVEVLLYDLADEGRLGHARAASFAVAGPRQAADPWACRHGPLSMVVPTVRPADGTQASGEEAAPGVAWGTKR